MGGTFNRLAGKVRPGTYVNFESTRQSTVGISERGTVLIPLIGHGYGPAKQFITIESAALDANIALLGYSVFDTAAPAMLLVREAFKNANTVVVYIPNQGASATGTAGALTATAAYGGSRGNDFNVAVVANPVAGFDVITTLGGQIVSNYTGLTTIEQLISQNDEWVTFSGTGALVAVAGLALTGGTDGTLQAGDITQFLDDSENVSWNTMAFPLDPDPTNSSDPVPALQTALLTKITYLRNSAGKYRNAVAANYAAGFEGIINVTNSVVVEGVNTTAGQATAWVAGATAGADNVTSLTHATYVGATAIIGGKNNAESIAAINNGEFFFSNSEAGDVIVEYDINSLLDFTAPKDETYRKNRVMRVFDSFGEALIANFPPNRFDNSDTGWDVMEGIGNSILLQFLNAGAIYNVDFDNDFKVDRGASSGDQTFFNVGLQPTDSAEKLFFTVETR